MASNSTASSVSSLPNGYMPKDKLDVSSYEKGIRFGKGEKPIQATTVFRARITHSKSATIAEKWIAINERAGTMTFVNTYDGKTGSGYDVDSFTFPLDLKRLNKKRIGMEEVSVNDCPVCVEAENVSKQVSELVIV
jgi:hypothetical protein